MCFAGSDTLAESTKVVFYFLSEADMSRGIPVDTLPGTPRQILIGVHV